MSQGLNYIELTAAELERYRPEIKELAVLSYGTVAAKIDETEGQAMLGRVADDVFWDQLLPNAIGILCFDGTKLIGMAFLTPSGNGWKFFQSDWSYIRMVGVDPDYRGNRIGTLLTEKCVWLARKMNEKIIALHTSGAQPDAVHIYEKMGFRILHEIPPRGGILYHVYTKYLTEINA